MIKKPVTLQSDLDMESRPIAHLVQEASQYDSTVYIEMDNMKINAKVLWDDGITVTPAGKRNQPYSHC